MLLLMAVAATVVALDQLLVGAPGHRLVPDGAVLKPVAFLPASEARLDVLPRLRLIFHCVLEPPDAHVSFVAEDATVAAGRGRRGMLLHYFVEGKDVIWDVTILLAVARNFTFRAEWGFFYFFVRIVYLYGFFLRHFIFLYKYF